MRWKCWVNIIIFTIFKKIVSDLRKTRYASLYDTFSMKGRGGITLDTPGICDYRSVAGDIPRNSYLRWDASTEEQEEVSRHEDNKKIGKLTDILGTTPCTQLRLAC